MLTPGRGGGVRPWRALLQLRPAGAGSGQKAHDGAGLFPNIVFIG